ncbi:hypothetical protein MHU86_23490 [Fragilaria crotonensis]|nr:hypothetical protein MHU86_23490 [Fragilaria crotonensis]
MHAIAIVLDERARLEIHPSTDSLRISGECADCEAKMGCGPSKHTLNTVDDSVHVMLKQDRKRQQSTGQESHGYVPRPSHKLLEEKATPIYAEEADDVLIPENGK